jgi:hypothetical protein
LDFAGKVEYASAEVGFKELVVDGEIWPRRDGCLPSSDDKQHWV